MPLHPVLGAIPSLRPAEASRPQPAVLSLIILPFCLWVALAQPLTVPAKRGQMLDIANVARRAGKSTIDAPVLIAEYPIVTSLEKALRISAPLLVRIEGKQARLDSDGNQIFTWYRATVIETLTGEPLPSPDAAPDTGISPPPSLGPPSRDTILIRTWGGTIVLGGVSVRMPEEPAPLRVGSTYVLFVSFDGNRDGTPTRTASLRTGDAAVFSYDDANGSLASLCQRHNCVFAAATMARAAASLSGLRAAVREAKPQ